jgi:hypothetical protein
MSNLPAGSVKLKGLCTSFFNPLFEAISIVSSSKDLSAALNPID